SLVNTGDSVISRSASGLLVVSGVRPRSCSEPVGRPRGHVLPLAVLPVGERLATTRSRPWRTSTPRDTTGPSCSFVVISTSRFHANHQIGPLNAGFAHRRIGIHRSALGPGG